MRNIITNLVLLALAPALSRAAQTGEFIFEQDCPKD